MENLIRSLLPLYREARERNGALALATLVETAGSTYRKAGTPMLIARDGRFAGLLSGGCLEGDLAERARAVIDGGAATFVSYDMRGPEDPLWGLGSGCEGAMRILLTYCGPNNEYRPLPWFEASLSADQPLVTGLTLSAAELPLGTWLAEVPPDAGASVLRVTLAPPPRLLLGGAGPDAPPVAQLAVFLGWRVVVADHRTAYLDAARFAPGVALRDTRPCAIAQLLGNQRLDALVIMSHHLDTDRGWLTAAAGDPPAYVGLLGPAPRRERLLGELTAAQRRALSEKLRAPVGLDLGGRSPESIALAIVSEIQAALNGRDGRPFSKAAMPVSG